MSDILPTASTAGQSSSAIRPPVSTRWVCCLACLLAPPGERENGDAVRAVYAHAHGIAPPISTQVGRGPGKAARPKAVTTVGATRYHASFPGSRCAHLRLIASTSPGSFPVIPKGCQPLGPGRAAHTGIAIPTPRRRPRRGRSRVIRDSGASYSMPALSSIAIHSSRNDFTRWCSS